MFTYSDPIYETERAEVMLMLNVWGTVGDERRGSYWQSNGYSRWISIVHKIIARWIGSVLAKTRYYAAPTNE